MAEEKYLHSICRWTFNAGKGGFVPADARPEWSNENLDTIGVVTLIKNRIASRLPGNIQLGLEVHYDTEVNEKNAKELADALVDAGIYLAFITPGAHSHFAYGGIASLDPKERKAGETLGTGAVDCAYGPLKKAWHPDPQKAPAFCLWNGSFGYDLASVGIKQMYQNLKEGVAGLCKYEAQKGGQLYICIEPKPNEGHPVMLLPTIASAIVFWHKLAEEFGISLEKKGTNKEFGHSEMIGLDHVYDTVEEIDNNTLLHMHLNSQGYNDGIILGGPGKFDIDHGVRINGMNIAIAGLIRQAGFNRWMGHDMQTRPYDNAEQGLDRVIRSVLSWQACAKAAKELNTNQLIEHLSVRQTAKAEDMMQSAVVNAIKHFQEMYE